MDLNGEGPGTDDYFVTARQIFNYCGAEGTETLRVDVLMDKFAPFVKTNKTEFCQLKLLLDPEHCNPELSVTSLANALKKYSEGQKIKIDLDESFNLRCGQVPQDSDSGISTDGFQLLEELQCELREKVHLAHSLRAQLDFADRTHEEALAALAAERDALRTHLNMLREENVSLGRVRCDYDEACERLGATEQALEEARRELDAARRRLRLLGEQAAVLETEKVTLQELLAKSKDECHRINEMYAGRQSALLEENEALRGRHADLAARLHDHQQLLQQAIREKLELEMELKDILNKSNQTQLRLERSIELSYTEDQMLTAMDSLHADSRFSPENQLLDEESFMRALRDDNLGRSTNISLFEEIRHSLNLSRQHMKLEMPETIQSQVDRGVDISTTTVGTQTENHPYTAEDKVDIPTECIGCDRLKVYAAKLESEVRESNRMLTEMQSELDGYDDKLGALQRCVDEGDRRSELVDSLVGSLEGKLCGLGAACAQHEAALAGRARGTGRAQSQAACDYASVATQAEAPCSECVRRNARPKHRRLRKYLWEPLRCLLQVFAVLCFAAALAALYGVTRRPPAPCARAALPWRWLHAQDLLDLLLSIEYGGEVPM